MFIYWWSWAKNFRSRLTRRGDSRSWTTSRSLTRLGVVGLTTSNVMAIRAPGQMAFGVVRIFVAKSLKSGMPTTNAVPQLLCNTRVRVLKVIISS